MFIFHEAQQSADKGSMLYRQSFFSLMEALSKMTALSKETWKFPMVLDSVLIPLSPSSRSVWLHFCQLQSLEKRKFQLRNCMHYIGQWERLWGFFIIKDWELKTDISTRLWNWASRALNNFIKVRYTRHGILRRSIWYYIAHVNPMILKLSIVILDSTQNLLKSFPGKLPLEMEWGLLQCFLSPSPFWRWSFAI